MLLFSVQKSRRRTIFTRIFKYIFGKFKVSILPRIPWFSIRIINKESVLHVLITEDNLKSKNKTTTTTTNKQTKQN